MRSFNVKISNTLWLAQDFLNLGVGDFVNLKKKYKILALHR